MQGGHRISAHHRISRLQDLELRIEAIDALCEHDIRALMQGLRNLLGGCMLLTMVLADGLFSGLSAENFNVSFKPKMGALEVLCDIVDMKKLDFLISSSSVSALFGNAGQTNYSAYVFSVVCTVHSLYILYSRSSERILCWMPDCTTCPTHPLL